MHKITLTQSNIIQDAEDIGLCITDFTAHSIDGYFRSFASKVAADIFKQHNSRAQTYSDAGQYHNSTLFIKPPHKLQETNASLPLGSLVRYEKALQNASDAFLKAILDTYHRMLIKGANT